MTPDSESSFQSVIEVVDAKFERVVRTIELYKVFPEMKDVQGVALNTSDSTIWICSCMENMIHQITMEGYPIASYEVDAPSGIAYNPEDCTLWVLTRDSLFEMDTNGEVLRSKEMHLRGQDQLYYDDKTGLLYMTYGNDYSKPNNLCIISGESMEILYRYDLHASYAVEGVSIVDSMMYILNDGYYHSAEVPVNEVVVYPMSQLRSSGGS